MASGRSIVRRAGTVVILYVFMHSYFGVGSLRNAFGDAAPAGVVRVLALLFGLCWVTLLVAGILLVVRNAWAIRMGQAAAAGWAALVLTEAVNILEGGGDASAVIFVASRPVFPLVLAVLLPSLARQRDGSPAHLGRGYFLASVIAGALMPWLAAAAVRAMSGPLVLSREPGPSISLFMSFWCAIPLAVVVLMANAVPATSGSRYAFAGGFTGAVAASFYAYSMIWAQDFNSFILAFLAPAVFAGVAIGMAAGMLLERLAGRPGR